MLNKLFIILRTACYNKYGNETASSIRNLGIIGVIGYKNRTKPKAVVIKQISEISRKMLAISDPSAYITR